MKIARIFTMIFALALSVSTMAAAAQETEQYWGFVDYDTQQVLVFGSMDMEEASTAKMAVTVFPDMLFEGFFDNQYDISKSRDVPKHCVVATGEVDGEDNSVAICYKRTVVYIVMSTGNEDDIIDLAKDFVREGEPVVPDSFEEIDLDDL